MARETTTISSVSSPEQKIVTIESDSNEPTNPYGIGNQHPIVPPSLNDLNLPLNPFNVLATMAVIQSDEEFSPQVPEPSNLSPMILSTIEGCETPLTTTDENTFSSEDESRRVYWDVFSSEIFDSNEPRQISITSSPSSTLPPPRRQKRKLNMGFTSSKFGQPLLTKKTP